MSPTQVPLGPAHVGRRVVVRHLLPDGRASDVVGTLTGLTGDAVTVLPDDRGCVVVPRGSVVAARAVPPRAVRPASSADDVQRVAGAGWPGLESERLGGWVLRAAEGFTGRANSALPVGDPGVPLHEAVDAVEAFYDARGLQPAVQVPFALDGPDAPAPGLDAVLAARGWGCDAPTLLMTADLRRLTGPGAAADEDDADGVDADGVDVDGVDVDAAPDEAWLGLYKYRGGELPAAARRVLTAGPLLGFGSLRRDGRTLAVGRVAVADGWAGVTAMETDRDHRRRGLGTAVLLSLLSWGAQQGARFGYLQVFASNAPAVAVYTGVGFTPHHRYHYRRRPV